jgi:GGDEF domain-containing protein
MVRSVMRYSMAVHLGLITISGKNDTELTVQKREKIMENLGTAIRNSVRRSDAGARCSATQYIVMLPRANYEDSCMVCERIIKAYYNGFSRLDVNLRYEVFPILLEDRENFNGENK